MPEHVTCNKETEIKDIHEICKRLDAAIRGNGKPGLVTQVAVLRNTVAGLIFISVTIISGLIALWLKG